MSFSFTLPTTSTLSFPAFTSSSTHPSLPLTASKYRGVLRNVLKKYKRLPSQTKASNLTTVLSALDDYIPYLLSLDAALSARAIKGEEIDLVLQREIEVEWRTSLAATIPGRDPPRAKGKGLDYEIAFVLHTLACVYTLQARAQLLTHYAPIPPTAEQRAATTAIATKHHLMASSIHNYLAARSVETDASSVVVETLSQTQGGLAALSLAEATLLAVLKDDPYPAIVIQDRNKDDKEWMIKAPEIPRVRAHLFARLCLASGEHASEAEAMLSASGRIEGTLITYVSDLKKTSRAKACRFFGINAELGGETGQAIAWLVGGMKELGFASSKDEGLKLKGLAKFKKDWTVRREDKKIERGGEWGNDAGRLEELRVIEMLQQKWNKMNDTINTQLIPSADPLVASMPSGRDFHSVKPYIPPSLDEDTLTRMRAPPEVDGVTDDDDSCGSEDEGVGKSRDGLPGGFPGSSYTTSNNDSYY